MADNAALQASGLSRKQIHGWRNGVFVVFALCGIGIASWMSRTPAIKAELAVSTAEMGILIFAIALGSILGLLSSSHLLARFGARAVMASCFVIAPIGLAVAGVAVTFGQLYWVAFVGLGVFGVGMATCDVAMNLSGAVNERILGRTIMPVFHAFFSFGTMIGAGLGALAELLQVPIALQTAIVSAIMLAVGLAAVRMTQSETILNVPDESGEHVPDGWRTRLAIWKDPRTLFIGLIVLGMAFAEGSANDWLSLAAVEGHGVDKPTGAVVFGIFVTAMTAGRLAGPRVLDRYGRVPVLRASAVLAAVGLLLFILVPVLWIAILGIMRDDNGHQCVPVDLAHATLFVTALAYAVGPRVSLFDPLTELAVLPCVDGPFGCDEPARNRSFIVCALVPVLDVVNSNRASRFRARATAPS